MQGDAHNYDEMSTEDLISRHERLLRTVNFLTIVLALLLIYTGYTSITHEFSYLIIVPVALSPLVFIGYREAKEMKKEIDSRDGR